MKHRALVVALVGLPAALRAGEAVGQQASLEARAGWLTDARGAAHAGLTLAPTVGWSAGPGRLALGAQGTLFREGGAMGGVAGRGDLTLLAARAASATLALEGRAAAAGGYAAAGGSAAPLLRLAAAGAGVEAGPRMEWAGERLRSGGAAPGGLFPLPRRGAAESRARAAAGVTAGAWVTRGPARLRADLAAARTAETAWREWRGAASVDARALTLELTAGLRQGTVAERWMGAGAALRVGEGVELVGEAGRAPSDPLTLRPGARYASAGLRLRAGATGRAGSAAPVPATGGARPVTLRARPGARVEILGEWSGWRAEPVPEAEPGVYTAMLRLAPGTYRFAFRVDGLWTTPAGVETEPDDYGGRRAVLRVTADDNH